MKKLLFFTLAALAFSVFVSTVDAAVYVKGHYRNGTYVEAHSAPVLTVTLTTTTVILATLTPTREK